MIVYLQTVGFIERLPHHLIQAFRSTLEEVKEADLLLHVVDTSFEDYQMQIETTNEVLKSLGVENTPMIYVYNKIDLNKYVPEGVAINGDSVVTVQIEISQLATKTFTIKKSDIAIENQGEQEVEIMGNVKITLQGESDKIAKISTGDIQASVNVDKLSAGKHSVTLDVTLPDGIIAVDEKKIDIKIK